MPFDKNSAMSLDEFSSTQKEVVKESSKSPFAYSETIAPLMHGASTVALGVPKAVAKADTSQAGQETYNTMYPEQETISGKILRGISETAGYTLGAPGIIGKAAIRGVEGLLAKKALSTTAKAAIYGGASGAALTPTDKPLDLGQRATTGAVSAAVPLGIKGVSATMGAAGKAIQNTVFGKKIAEYARNDSRWSNILNKEFESDSIPQDIKQKLSNLFPNAKNAVGGKLENLINTKYKAINAPTQSLQDDVQNLVRNSSLDDLMSSNAINSREKKVLEQATLEVLGELQKPSNNGFIPVNKLWSMRKELDKKFYGNQKLTSEEAKLYWASMRKIINSPVRKLGGQVEKAMNDYEYISNAEDMLGNHFTGVINKNTQKIESPATQAFLQGLLSRSDKGEVINLLKGTEKFTKLDDAIVGRALDYATARNIQTVGSTSSGHINIGDMLHKPLRGIVGQTSKASESVQRLINGKPSKLVESLLK